MSNLNFSKNLPVANQYVLPVLSMICTCHVSVRVEWNHYFQTYRIKLTANTENNWISYSELTMGSPQLYNGVRWQIIGIREADMSLRQIAQRVGHHHSIIGRIMSKHQITNDIKDLLWSGRARITSRREDNAPTRLVRRNPLFNSTVLKRQWLPHRLLSARTVRNRLKSVGYRSRRLA